MALDMWFKDDITNILLSLDLALAATSRWAEGSQVEAYRHGYEAALMATAVAFGLSPRVVLGASRSRNGIREAPELDSHYQDG